MVHHIIASNELMAMLVFFVMLSHYHSHEYLFSNFTLAPLDIMAYENRNCVQFDIGIVFQTGITS